MHALLHLLADEDNAAFKRNDETKRRATQLRCVKEKTNETDSSVFLSSFRRTMNVFSTSGLSASSTMPISIIPIPLYVQYMVRYFLSSSIDTTTFTSRKPTKKRSGNHRPPRIFYTIKRPRHHYDRITVVSFLPVQQGEMKLVSQLLQIVVKLRTVVKQMGHDFDQPFDLYRSVLQVKRLGRLLQQLVLRQ